MLSTKEIEYFSEQLPEHLCVMHKPEFFLSEGRGCGKYFLRVRIEGIGMFESLTEKTKKEWRDATGIKTL